MQCFAMRSERLGCGELVLRTQAEMKQAERIAERLGFAFEGIQRRANMLPGGKTADRYCYARFDVLDLPHLEVSWEGRADE